MKRTTFYESDFGVISFDESVYSALNNHKRLSRKLRDRTCFKQCRACDMENYLNGTAAFIFSLGGILRGVRKKRDSVELIIK